MNLDKDLKEFENSLVTYVKDQVKELRTDFETKLKNLQKFSIGAKVKIIDCNGPDLHMFKMGAKGVIVDTPCSDRYDRLRVCCNDIEYWVYPEDIEPLPQPLALPKWIEKDKWVELVDSMRIKYFVLIDHIDLEDEMVHYKKIVWSDNGNVTPSGRDTIEHVLKGKPFTPPSQPELPSPFSWSGDWVIYEKALRMPLDAWIAASREHKKVEAQINQIKNALPYFLAIQEHIREWGTE